MSAVGKPYSKTGYKIMPAARISPGPSSHYNCQSPAAFSARISARLNSACAHSLISSSPFPGGSNNLSSPVKLVKSGQRCQFNPVYHHSNLANGHQHQTSSKTIKSQSISGSTSSSSTNGNTSETNQRNLTHSISDNDSGK